MFKKLTKGFYAALCTGTGVPFPWGGGAALYPHGPGGFSEGQALTGHPVRRTAELGAS